MATSDEHNGSNPKDESPALDSGVEEISIPNGGETAVPAHGNGGETPDQDDGNDAPALSPKAVLRFLAPTLALWIAPPIMSLIDSRYSGMNLELTRA